MDYLTKLQEISDKHDVEIEVSGSSNWWYVNITCSSPEHYISCKRETLEEALNYSIHQFLHWIENEDNHEQGN